LPVNSIAVIMPSAQDRPDRSTVAGPLLGAIQSGVPDCVAAAFSPVRAMPKSTTRTRRPCRSSRCRLEIAVVHAVVVRVAEAIGDRAGVPEHLVEPEHAGAGALAQGIALDVLERRYSRPCIAEIYSCTTCG